jgi:hypothetical protein
MPVSTSPVETVLTLATPLLSSYENTHRARLDAVLALKRVHTLGHGVGRRVVRFNDARAGLGICSAYLPSNAGRAAGDKCAMAEAACNEAKTNQTEFGSGGDGLGSTSPSMVIQAA